ncbi:MAG: L,D-transpeptidase family protein [Rhodobiaceae bacterium]|nr:L,D-transpeptidase family protein [Rhodobiaceae bacterium]
MNGRKDRRGGMIVAVLAVLCAVFATGTPAAAQLSSADRSNWLDSARGSAEWGDQFDSSGGSHMFQAAQSPLLGPHAVPALVAAIDRYQQIVAAGGWEPVPNGPTLRVGVRNRNVAALRRRLATTGDLSVAFREGEVFDSYVEKAVKTYQTRNGITPTGVVDEATLNALNVPANARLAQLRSNLDRFAAMTEDPGERYVVVNIPGAEIEAVENGAVVSRHTAVVGKIDRQTPLLTSKIFEINFNPYWTVPKSIIRRDVIPTVRKDPEYLKKYNIRILDENENEIDPLAIDWSTDEAVDYMFRQDPGDINSLGTVKINFHNKYQVYLHDTPGKGLFAQNFRFHSSGCVRVQNVRELVAWILRGQEDWSRAKIDAVIRSGERLDVPVENPVTIHTVYITAWANTDGTVHFRDDIYKADSGGLTLATQ